MKTTMKNLFSLILMVSVLFLASCSKSDDPTPTTPTVQTNLDKVKATLVGTWTFQSVKVTEISTSKSATTSTCDRTELKDAKFTAGLKKDVWIDLTPQFNFVYSSATSAQGSNRCASAGSPYNISIVENADKTVNVTLDAGGNAKQVYNVNINDITATTIKGILISNADNISSTNGYRVEYEFKR
jgi:hypothetical protein